VSKLTLGIYGSGPGAGTFVAQLLACPSGGRSSTQTVLLEIGRDTTVDVAPGHVSVQVRLPSGELLDEERTIAQDRDDTIAFNLGSARHEWLGWQQMLTPRIAPEVGARGPMEFPVGKLPIAEVRIHRGGKAPIVVPLDTSVGADRATYRIQTDATTVSLTIERYEGVRPLIELVKTDGGREIAALPLPWYDEAANALPIQLFYEIGPSGEPCADVIVHDPVFSPMLAYYATGDRAATRKFSQEIERRARQAIEGELQNPCAATAGLLVLRRLHRTNLPDHLFENLAGITSISDGAILYAQHLREKRNQRSDRNHVRAVLLEAVQRGVPMFSECGRMLRDGLRRVAAAEQKQSQKASPEVKAALEWASELVDASRADTIITWLATNSAALSKIVPSVVAPSPTRICTSRSPPVNEAPEELFPTGVDESGALLTAKIDIAKLASAIRTRGATPLDPSTAAANARAGLESMGLPFGITPDNLAKAGWGVVFADDVPASVREKLKPLLDHRKVQADRRYKELDYQRGESVRDWMVRHGVGFSNITPSKVPYHLLLVGSPSSMSFEFQYQLDLEYSVGRLWFDDEAGFANYAASIVEYQTAAAVPTRKVMSYFGPSGDPATDLSSKHLLSPLHDGTDEDAAIAGELGFQATSFIGAAAKKAALIELLHDGDQRPALIFTASHGLKCKHGSQVQRKQQGGLVTAEHSTSAALDPAKALFAASDVRDDATIHGLVAFVFACFGAGTPQRDQFPQNPDELGTPEAIAPEPFIAALPQRLLGLASGGALAVIGHVERAWAYSITPPKLGPQIQPFRNAIGRLLKGEPVGEATVDLSSRHATLSAEMAGILGPGAAALDDRALVYRWIEQNDARNYILLGDPAVRLRSADMT
jgi:hypothetical protein